MRGRFVLGVAATLIACNTLVGFDDLERVDLGPDDGGPDRGVEPADAGVDAPAVTDGARCNANAPFEAPVPATDLDGDAQVTGAAVMTEDELEIFYRRRDGDAGELRHGRRADAATPWGPANVTTEEALSPVALRAFSITRQGLKFYYEDPILRMRFVTRATTSDAFGSATLYFDDVIKNLFVVADDEFVYASYQPDSASPEHVLVRAANPILAFESFQPFEYGHVPGAVDSNPILNPSQTRLYFTVTRDDAPDFGEIYVTTRATKTAPFPPATRVAELSSPGHDVMTWVAEDDCEVLLERKAKLFRARRPR